jgi:hypothetical protein
MRQVSLVALSVALLLLVAVGCGSEMTDEESSTAGTTAGSGGTYYTGSSGSSGYGATGGAGQSGTGGLGGTGGTSGSAGEAGTAGWPGTGGTSGWPGTAGNAGWPGTAGNAGWPGTGGNAGWPGTGGSSGWQGGGNDVALEDTPAEVQATVTDQLGDTPVDRIQQNDENGTITYQVDATVDGNRVEYTIAEDGTLLRTTEEIDPTAIPEAVMNTVTQEAGDAPEIRRAERVTEEGQVTYEIRISSAQGGRGTRLTIAEDGTLLEGGGGGQQGG